MIYQGFQCDPNFAECKNQLHVKFMNFKVLISNINKEVLSSEMNIFACKKTRMDSKKHYEFNLQNLKRIDNQINDILGISSFVILYEFESEWVFDIFV